MSLNLNQIKATTKSLNKKIVDTPFIDLASSKVKNLFPEKTKVKMKLEFLQHVGSFKARGVLLGLAKLTLDQKKRNNLKKKGIEWSENFSWKKNTKMTFEIITKV